MHKVLQLIRENIVPYQPVEVVKQIFGNHYHAVKSEMTPVVLFCAGASGKVLVNFLAEQKIFPVAFCDNNSTIIGQKYCDLPIISFDELKKSHQNSIVLIASAAYQRFIKAQLLNNGFKEQLILTLDSDNQSFDDQLKSERVLMLARNGEPNNLWSDYVADQNQISAAYGLLADEKSKDIFIKRLGLVASGYAFETYKNYLIHFSEPVIKFGFDNPERLNYGGVYFYFNNDVLNFEDGEVFIDGGAYNGDSADSFITACDAKGVTYESIHCFEPDQNNYQELLKYSSAKRNVVCYHSGLWNETGEIKFVSSDQTESYGARIQESSAASQGIADVTINTSTIDDYFGDKRATLIKMDIEGAEYEALEGAAMTMEKYAPKLAISVYHKIDDIYRIPLLIKSIQPGYKFYLRHLSNYFDDTILFAVAEDIQ